MKRNVLIITGAAGFLGSAITLDLARENTIIAIDRREPGQALSQAAPGVTWARMDIADDGAVAAAFELARAEHGRVDFVLHLAAFYHFGTDWRPEYERTNVRGTAHVLRAARKAGARRLIFASSIAAMEPPPPDQTLTEKTPTADFIPYAKSKRMGEEMLAEGADRLPAALLRIAGAFSDWCELPPLYGLVRMWSGWGPLSRLVPGRGESAIPYIHRTDAVRIVRRCIECHAELAPLEVFLASQSDAVSHQALFPVIRRAARRHAAGGPIFIPPRVARLGLVSRSLLGSVTGNIPYEQPWMLDFVDRPWVVDNSYTQGRLGWRPSPGMGILDRLPVILKRFRSHRRAWVTRNQRRNAGQYVYSL